MYLVECVPEKMTIKVLELLYGFFLVQMDVPILPISEVILVNIKLQRDFSEYHQMQVAITENQLGTMKIMSQIEEY